MRLIIRDERQHFDRQTHAYAEYRAFSTLAGHENGVDEVTVALAGPDPGTTGDRRVVCRVAVRMESGEAAEVQAMARHPYAAIDRAVALARRISTTSAGAALGPASTL